MQEHYPDAFARAIRDAWPSGPDAAELPPNLEQLLSTCYQASLLREEGRPITFRLLFAQPDGLAQNETRGRQVLLFEEPRPFSASELRRLTAASEFYRSMIGASCDGGTAKLWGMVHTGPRWSREILGGRVQPESFPGLLVVQTRSPGELSVYRGSQPIATLRGGEIELEDMNVFASAWLPQHFADVRTEVMAQHAEARLEADEDWAELDPDFIRVLAQNVVRRTIGVMQQKRHGGTVLFLPPDSGPELTSHLAVKYSFADTASRRRFRTILVRAMNSLARLHGGKTTEPVGWREYSESPEPELNELDDAIFEIGHLFADLSSVDGALVLTQRFEVLGFGAEISGELPQVERVWKSDDHDGSSLHPEDTDTFGTRHRSVFRLCAAFPNVLAIVVSQDGQVRFVKNLDGRVAFFNHRVLGAH